MEKFTFAGFTWPRPVYILPKPNTPEGLKKKRDGRKYTGGYTHAPRPLQAGESGRFFYLDSDFQPAPRWRWADEVNRSIQHTGWYYNDFGDTIRGIVMDLPHGRHLAGWSMGTKMASIVDAEIYTDEEEAARAADHLAEEEREYEEEERERIEAEEEQERQREEAAQRLEADLNTEEERRPC